MPIKSCKENDKEIKYGILYKYCKSSDSTVVLVYQLYFTIHLSSLKNPTVGWKIYEDLWKWNLLALAIEGLLFF